VETAKLEGGVAVPECPTCHSADVDALREDGGIRRYQCRSEKCGEVFIAVLRRGEPVARLQEPQGRKEEADVADLNCEKCGKKYQRGGKRYEDHVANCKGEPQSSAEKRPKRAKRVKGGKDYESPVRSAAGAVADAARDRAVNGLRHQVQAVAAEISGLETLKSKLEGMADELEKEAS